MTNTVDQDQMASSQAIRSISTMFSKAMRTLVQQGKGLRICHQLPKRTLIGQESSYTD